MIATYQGSGAELTFSIDTVFEPSSAAATSAVGPAQCSGVVAPVTPPRTTTEEDIEDEINKLEQAYLEFIDYKLIIRGAEYAKYYFILRTLSE